MVYLGDFTVRQLQYTLMVQTFSQNIIMFAIIIFMFRLPLRLRLGAEGARYHFTGIGLPPHQVCAHNIHVSLLGY